MTELNIITYKVQGLNHPIKRKKVYTQLKKLNCTIALLQEPHLSDLGHKKLKKKWVGQVHSTSCGNNRGLARLIHKTVAFSVEIVQDKFGRFVGITGRLGEMEISMLQMNIKRISFACITADNSKSMIILAGEFNAVQNRQLDRSHCRQWNPK